LAIHGLQQCGLGVVAIKTGEALNDGDLREQGNRS
jgi:hypothetical protein